MDGLQGHHKVFKIIVVVALVALIVSSFLPFAIYLFQ